MSTRRAYPLENVTVQEKIRLLQTVEGLKHLGFYAIKHESKDARVCGREATLPCMSESEANELATKLNKAIEVVLAEHADHLLAKAANSMRNWL